MSVAEPSASPRTFVERGYTLTVTAAPLDGGFELQLSDAVGRIRMPCDFRIGADDLKLGREAGKDPLAESMGNLQDAIAHLSDEHLESLITGPREQLPSQRTQTELAAIRAIDWRAGEQFMHLGRSFTVAACTTQAGLLVMLRDCKGVYDASIEVPAAELSAAARDGVDLAARAIALMREYVASMGEMELSAFLNAMRLPSGTTGVVPNGADPAQ